MVTGMEIMAIGSGLGSLWQSLDTAARQRKERKKLLRQLGEQETKAINELNLGLASGEKRFESEILRSRTAGAARDPFMEAAAASGARNQVFGQVRKAQQAGLGARSGSGAMQQARSQSILARESMRLKRQGEYNQLIAQQVGQLGELTQAGIRTRADIRTKYSGMRAEVGSMEQSDPLGAALGGMSSALMTAALGSSGTSTMTDEQLAGKAWAEKAAQEAAFTASKPYADFGAGFDPLTATPASPPSMEWDWGTRPWGGPVETGVPWLNSPGPW